MNCVVCPSGHRIVAPGLSGCRLGLTFGLFGLILRLPVLVLPAWVPFPAGAQPVASQPSKIEFDIPAQSLGLALDAYADASHLQVLVETALLAGRQSASVRGAYAPEEALGRMLAGSGLDFKYTAERSVTLVPAQTHGTDLTKFYPLLGGIQARVMAALCRYPATRPGAFRIGFRFRIGERGNVEDLSLLGSSGRAERDAAIKAAVSRIAFGQPPPPVMPQPVIMILQPSASGKNDCSESGG